MNFIIDSPSSKYNVITSNQLLLVEVVSIQYNCVPTKFQNKNTD